MPSFRLPHRASMVLTIFAEHDNVIIVHAGRVGKCNHRASLAASWTALTKLDTSATPFQAMSNAVP